MTRFDDEFIGSLDSDQDGSRRAGINPFEIALWVLTAALLLGGIGSLYFVAARSGQGQALGGSGYVATQMVYSIGPGAVTAGLFAAIVSLALRAFLLAAARRASAAAAVAAVRQAAPVVAPEPPAAAAEPTPVLDPLQFAPPQFRSRRRTVDHSAFKRPPVD